MSKWEEKEIDGFKYWEIEVKGGTIAIEPRQRYCDRGRYYAKIFTNATPVDDADMFPRYYFDLDRAKAEMDAFIKCRGIE